MLTYLAAFVVGLVLLMWSADKFVEGAASAATRLGMPRLLVGMVIVGFGTSAPEMAVSALSALENNPGIALGNAYGSNIANIALILGITVIIRPIGIERSVMRRELPILLCITLISLYLLHDGYLSSMDAIFMIVLFTAIITYSIVSSMREAKRMTYGQNELAKHMGDDSNEEELMPMKHSIFWVFAGLILLVVSSRILVWSSVSMAVTFGISNEIIGLTIVAIGTSLPELASAIAATKRNEHALVIGNILGSNFFNTLMVVGIAGAIQPMPVSADFLSRDIVMTLFLTVLVFIFGIRFGREKEGVITRFEGVLFISVYVFYTVYLVSLVMGRPLFVWPSFGLV